MKVKIYELHAQMCQTLANPKRLEILDLLSRGEKSVTELLSLLNIRQANLSQHLAILKQNGIVTARRQGVNVYYKIANPKIIKACNLLKEVFLEKITETEKIAQKAFKPVKR